MVNTRTQKANKIASAEGPQLLDRGYAPDRISHKILSFSQ